MTFNKNFLIQKTIKNQIMYSNEFFIRLQMIERDGIFLHRGVFSLQIAISRVFLVDLLNVINHGRYTPRQLHQIFNLYIFNWWNSDFQTVNLNEQQIRENQTFFVIWILGEAQTQITRFIQNNSSDVGFFLTLYQDEHQNPHFNVEPWNNQIDCSCIPRPRIP